MSTPHKMLEFFQPFYNLENMNLLRLKDLPDNLRVNLDDNFRRKLFRRAKIIQLNNLIKKLGCCETTYYNLKNGKSFIKVGALKKLAEITKISLAEIEKFVVGLKSRKKKRKIPFRLPIKATPEIAYVVGCVFGDGSLSDRQFSYFNKSGKLREKLKSNLNKAFSTRIKPKEFNKSGGREIEYPMCIAKLLWLIGAPKGNKMFINFEVPKWIKMGSKEIKRNFLRALFNDEGWVKIKYNKKSKSFARMIGIDLAKSIPLLDNLRNFLNELREMLKEFGISSSPLIKICKTRNGIALGFTISNLSNLLKFYYLINFTDKRKEMQLLECIKSYKRFNYKMQIINIRGDKRWVKNNATNITRV
jgi:intein/homing endonuclease